ncbi:ATP-dependent RecD-like DNA helicase [Lacrimispora sp.]|uniref:ATP-dependent DNA helicase n=1 Tax=Lacrimispora sp. TaxID=2719234 RepID=UPI0029E16A6B|nr:hypothetical protein [Lacrimispora sp.]
MLGIDEQVINIDKVICRHIGATDFSSRGAVSQDILAQLRNFVEHIMLKFYAQGNDINDSYENICKAVKYSKTNAKLKVLNKFYDYLEIVASHYTLDEENSERLMLKYYTYLFKIRILLKDKYGLELLGNLEKFPLRTDPKLKEYYSKIAGRIDSHIIENVGKSDKYYVQKIKPFFVNEKIYYEVTFTPAADNVSKFNRVIAFTSLDVTDYYAVKFSFRADKIELLGKTMPILVITGWEVAIRDCEYKNFIRIINGSKQTVAYTEQQGISRFLTNTGFCLSDLIGFEEDEYQKVKNICVDKSRTITFFTIFDECRSIVIKNGQGANILRYLLLHMNNKIMKNQSGHISNAKLSGLYLQNGCIPFDTMPFINAPIGHNPKLRDLFECIPSGNRRHELLARFVKNNIEINGQLFTSVSEITCFNDIEKLVKIYNSKLWSGHRPESDLSIENGQIFIERYKTDTCFIINQLRERAKTGIQNYTKSVESWLQEDKYVIDSKEKRIALLQMFDKSQVALIYGAAGTGKSYMINHLAHFFADRDKMFLAQTNPAVDNMKRRVTASNSKFSTIAKFLSYRNNDTKFDVLIIDECSTVNNKDMREILEKASFKLLILVGDIYQISSIRFGNWFSIAKYFIPDTSVFELKNPYRSKDEGLLTLWDRVRNSDDRITELIAKKGYSTTLDDSIFSQAEEDEIILCLNYDGLYGINNINRFLQESNQNNSFFWGIQQFKIDDPILFNDSERFSPVIYNNMKGKILGIQIVDQDTVTEHIQFDVELDKVINGMDAYGQDFQLLEDHDTENSVIRFTVNKLKNVDEDDDGNQRTEIPFQIAYAVSIHKAQGLEYRSVKLVITEEIDELITHNIFYTAITRAREQLKIYWTPEVEHDVLERIKPKDIKKDVGILRKYLNQE